MLSDENLLRRLLGSIVSAKGEIVDLQAEAADSVVSLLALLVGAGYVLHGSNRMDGPPRLSPHRANDVYRPEGNRLGVYATTDWVQALLHALLDRAALTARLGSLTVSYRRTGPWHELSVTEPLRSLIRQADPSVWAPGLVYILPRAAFAPSASGSTEIFSPIPVTATARLRVGAALSRLVCGEDLEHLRG